MEESRSERIAMRQADVLTRLLAAAQSWVRDGLPLDSGLSRFYHHHPEFGSRDRRLFSGTVFSYFRWKGWIDRVARDVETACVFAHLLETSALHPAVLTLAAPRGLPASDLRPMGLLPIREKALSLGDITKFTLTLPQLVPDWVLPLLGPDPEPTIESFQKPPPTWLRIRPEARHAVMAELQNSGAEPHKHPSIPSALSVSRGINLRALPRPVRDQIDIQDLASQVTGLVCAPAAGETWWDACCGSGGKTLHLAELGGGTASILATDIRGSILDELSRRIGPDRRRSIRTALWDGTRQPPPAGPFDGILLDAPCSGTGTLAKHPELTWIGCEIDLPRLVEQQRAILEAAVPALAPGGLLVYAVCSWLPEEGEAHRARLLGAHPALAPADLWPRSWGPPGVF
ncbi:MAG: RsmB/NOP family class I SAM-dependent RNA methyltransferase, partial [bacterium]